MTEGLREVAQQLATGRVYLLGEQPNIIHISNRLFEGRPGPLDLPSQRLRLGKPERAEEKCSLLAGESIGSSVAVDQAVRISETLSNRVDGGSHPWVGSG